MCTVHAVDEHLHVMDDALLRVRRLWSTNLRQVVEGGTVNVEFSSVLVVEACARGAAAGDEVTVGDVARFADVEHSTASRLTDRAVRAGLVLRNRSVHDVRRTALTLTPAGFELRARSVRFRTAWLARALSGWDQDDLATLARLLGRFAAAVAEHGGPGASGPQPPAPTPNGSGV